MNFENLNTVLRLHVGHRLDILVLHSNIPCCSLLACAVRSGFHPLALGLRGSLMSSSRRRSKCVLSHGVLFGS